MSFGGDSNNSASQPIIGTGFPSAVMDWKEWVTERCKANNDASIDLLNALIQCPQH